MTNQPSPMQENITAPQAFLRPFPDPETVFAEPVDKYARHLLPLVSIDLSAVNPDWQGWIHLLNPCEPEEGYVGEDTEEHHSYYCRANWLGFRLTDDNKYEFLADWRYFTLEGKDADEYTDLQEHYEHQHQIYAAAKADFTEQGLLYSPYFHDPERKHSYGKRPDKPSHLLDQLGGAVGWGNWVELGDYEQLPLDTSNEEDIRPLTPDGKPFHFIAAVPAYNYCAEGADWILLFFEPESRTALLTFDWS